MGKNYRKKITDIQKNKRIVETNSSVYLSAIKQIATKNLSTDPPFTISFQLG